MLYAGALVLVYTTYTLLCLLVHWCMFTHPVYYVVCWYIGARVHILYIVLHAGVLVHVYTSYIMYVYTTYILCCMPVHWCMCTHSIYCVVSWYTGACIRILYKVLYIVLYAGILLHVYTSFILCCRLMHWCICTHTIYCVVGWCTGARVHRWHCAGSSQWL